MRKIFRVLRLFFSSLFAKGPGPGPGLHSKRNLVYLATLLVLAVEPMSEAASQPKSLSTQGCNAMPVKKLRDE